ncbi:ABC transporter permease [Marinospirillum alkaliphilum]|uniref:Iron(III) transport system permease protein n=1 Tax=Marinospirillum alkaliphilum DSM 21637 TaxID=1122209 RepID=A0A1K1WYY1_9GAMM|nr:iron ABC transporter permease [Marinospirillum alkaliphilum]SFX42275.1 iron(III) transport system permease protein [Marinospirillum alkaliphilum DSM 21637]
MTASAVSYLYRVWGQRPPFYILIPSVIAALAMVLPLFYLGLRAFQADPAMLVELVFRQRNLDLLLNTLKLTLGVLVLTTLMALPTAWLVTRTDIRFKKAITLLAVVPLAVPGYVMAYALMGLGGHFGIFAQLFGWQLPRIQGYTGAVLALSFYTFSYLFLNLRAALLGLDRSLEESAQSLGYSPREIFFRILLPHLAPSLMAGWLVIGLYVMGDFGAVALMRYEAFSYAIYTQYSGAFDRVYAAWLSLMLLALAASFVLMETLVLKRKRLASVGSGIARPRAPARLGWLAAPAWLFLGVVFLVSIGLPVMILAYWLLLAPPDISFFLQVPATFLRSAAAAFPAALVAAAFALPICYLLVRYPSRISTAIERSTYIGYALPPLTLALAMVFFSLHTAFFLYQTLALLIFTWAIATLALAMGPIRSALLQTRANQEEAAFSLGHGPISTFWYVVFPRLKRGILASLALVFLFCMKELPITFLLAPTGYTTLAVTVFSRTSEGFMAEAAPFAAAIVIFSSLSVGMVLNREGKQ